MTAVVDREWHGSFFVVVIITVEERGRGAVLGDELLEEQLRVAVVRAALGWGGGVEGKGRCPSINRQSVAQLVDRWSVSQSISQLRRSQSVSRVK